FVQAVDRVGTVVNEKFRAITILLKDNLARLSVVSTQLGAATEEIDVDFPYADEIELCVDYKYIYETLQTIQEEEVECFLSDAQTSIKLNGMNNKVSTFVLMPLGVE
ncbi:MAG: hypothetical protein Q8K36_06375, partial [Alphaproteobacteria bacterium]|nr:hypothetical protein [Alphaproteobacteria bacterium]